MKSSIRAQFLTFAFAAILFTGASVCWYSLQDGWRFNLSRIESEIRSTAAFFAAAVADDLYLGNVDALKRELENLLVNREISFARVLSRDGEQLVGIAASGADPVHIGPDLINQALAQDRWLAIRVDDRLEGVMPIALSNGKRLGAIHVVGSLKAPLEALKERALWSIVITLICMLAVATSVWGFSRKLLTDINAMIKSAESIVKGDLRLRVAHRRRDEIGALGDSINRVAETLQANEETQARAEAQIIQLNFELEAKVARRTAELTARNEDLAAEIARREKLEESLLTTNARHRAVVEIAPDAVVTTDERGNIVEFNKVAETTFGYNRQEVLGKPMADYLTPPEFRAGYQAGLTLIARGNDALLGKRVEITAMRAGGAQFPVEFAIVPVDIPGGRLLTAFMRDITERKRQENAVREAEQKLRELVETAQAIVWETSALTWKFAFVSLGAEAILGYPIARWMEEAHFWPSIIHADDLSAVMKDSEEQTTMGLGHELEYRVRAADGRIVWLTDFVRVVKNSEGKVVGRRGIKIDITSRKHVEESLRQSLSGMLFVQEISRKLLVADDSVVALDEILRDCVAYGNFDLGTILLVGQDSEAVTAMAACGYRDQQNVQRGPRSIGDGEQARYRSMSLKGPYVQENIQGGDRLRALEREGAESALLVPIGQGENSIGFFQLATRSKAVIDQRLIPLMETIGQQIGMSIQKARLLNETQRNFKRTAALHEINLAATSTLELGRVLDLLLTQVEAFLPYSAGSAIRLIDPASGKLALKVARNFATEDIGKFLREHSHTFAHVVFASKTPVWVADAPNDPRCPDPEFYRRHGMASYLGVPLVIKGEAIGVLSLLGREQRDVKADEIEFINLLAGQAAMAIHNAQLFENIRNQAIKLERAKEIEAAAAAKSRFLAMMSHEIRTPLNAVIGLTELMLKSDLTDDQRQMAETVKQSGSGLLDIINDILDFSKLEADKVAIEPLDFNLTEVVMGAVNIMSAQAHAKGLRLNLNVAPDVPRIVTGDGGRIRQVLLNLLGNAIKFTADGAVTVTVEVAEENSDGMLIKFSVADQGTGISTEAQARLFQPFTRPIHRRLAGSAALG